MNGTFAEYCLADANYVGLLPDNVDFHHIAPVLCAGVTVYKGLKMTEARPGEWVVISGVGGLGHLAVQYAAAMGMNVAAVDVDDSKLELACRLGASVVVNAVRENPVQRIHAETGGAHGVLVTAVSPAAFSQATGMMRRGGTMVLNGLPPGKFDLSIFDMVLDGITVRGSIVGTRKDLQEALFFTGQHKVHAEVTTEPLENINSVFGRMRAGKINGRIVIDMTTV